MIQKDAAAYRRMGQTHRLNNDLRSAVTCLQQAVALDEKDHESHAMLAHIFKGAGELRRTVLHAMFALLAQPENISYKKTFLAVAGSVPFLEHSPLAETALLFCLETPDLDCSEAQGLWHSLFSLHPEFSQLIKKESIDLADTATLELLLRPFFLRGIEQIVIIDKDFEDFIARLRRSLAMKETHDKKTDAITAAIACYAFNTEYILDITPEEEQAVEKLRANSALHDIRTALLLCCYMPIHDLPTARDMLEKSSYPLLAESHIHEPRRLRERKSAVVRLTEISGGVSAEVRAQYESFPYPRWRSLPPPSPTASQEKLYPAPGAEVLVAGCGTGKEALSLAVNFPEANILAVDLSCASLAYAAEKAEKLGIKNVSFRHADILLLGDALKAGSYDYITSMGVLHHMEDPMKGWRVLQELLKPGGTMAIGLYSKTGRPDIFAARKAVTENGFLDSTEEMRRFRHSCRAFLPAAMAEMLEKRKDYYYTSMCRDLVFHVQEHCFDVSSIRKCLMDLDLTFAKFKLPAVLRGKPPAGSRGYPQATDIDGWEAYERKHPETFRNMYKFWCKKPG